MRKILLAAVGAMALVGGTTAASAAVVVASGTIPSSLTSLTPPTSFTIGANLSGGSGSFGPTYYTFTTTMASLFNGQISSIEDATGIQNINFMAPTLTAGSSGTGATLATFMETSVDPNPETWAIKPANAVLLAAGTYTIDVSGTLNSSNGAYSGSFNVANAPAVPEPATWAMMLLGFGAVGMVIRRRRKPVLAQLA